MNWGPYGGLFGIPTYLQGVYQVALGAALIAVVFLLNRRAVWLMAGGVVSAAVYQALNLLIHRPRPDRHLVHALAQFPGYSYPSGHAAFFSCFGILVLFALRPHLRGGLWVIGWMVVVLIVVTACISRIDVGAHWPSDILGGLALGTGCASLALSIRRLSDPVFES